MIKDCVEAALQCGYRSIGGLAIVTDFSSYR